MKATNLNTICKIFERIEIKKKKKEQQFVLFRLMTLKKLALVPHQREKELKEELLNCAIGTFTECISHLSRSQVLLPYRRSS